jgi:hypothetical protein
MCFEQWRTQDFFFLGGGGFNKFSWGYGREHRSGGGSPPSQGFYSICKWVKPVFLLDCYICIFHGTGNSAQLCHQNFGISGGGGWTLQTTPSVRPWLWRSYKVKWICVNFIVKSMYFRTVNFKFETHYLWHFSNYRAAARCESKKNIYLVQPNSVVTSWTVRSKLCPYELVSLWAKCMVIVEGNHFKA